MNRLPMNNALKSIAWLEGTWITETLGEGKFPTIKPFAYCEEIKFISIGQPMFNYESQSWHPERKNPMHREVGFLKCIPESNKVSLILAHNFGLTTVEEGVVCDKQVKLQSTSISRVSDVGTGSQRPFLTELYREFRLVDDAFLEQIVYMATSKTLKPTEHLHARYIRQLPQQ